MAFLAAVTIGLLALIAPKAVVLLAGAAALLILAARRPQSPRAPRLFTALLLLNAVSLAISTTLSPNRWLSLYGGSGRGFGALAQSVAMLFAWLIAWQCAGRPDRARAVLRGVAIAAVLVAAYEVEATTWLLVSAFLSMALAAMETHRVLRGLARATAAIALVASIVIAARTLPWTHPRTQLWAGPHRLLWRDSLSMAVRRPATGYGAEVYLAEFPHFESKALAQQNPDSIYDSPHNAFLDALISQGAPGLLLLCGLCVPGFAAAWKRRTIWLAAALAAGIAGLQFTSFTMPTAVLFLTTIALTAALAEKPAAPRPSPIFSAIVPLLVVALLYFALRIAVADHALATTRRLLDFRDLPAVTAEYDAYGTWRLPGASADLWYSRAWMEIARTAADPAVRSQAVTIAGQAAQRAVANAEAPCLAWYNRAQISAFQNNSADAERSLRWAIAAHPNWYLPHWMLSQLRFREGRIEEAQTEAALAAELDAGHHPEIAPLYVIR
jgi:hypothetical protein